MAAKNKKRCNAAFAEARSEHENALKEALIQMRIDGFQTYSKDEDIAKVQKEVTRLWVEDQAARRVYIRSDQETLEGTKAHFTRRLAALATHRADEQSTRILKELLERYDWIDVHRFSEKTSAHAWILAQHADSHPEFQQFVLSKMEPHLETGGVRKRDYAYLWDRVAVNHDRLQRYGTQPDWNCKPDNTLDFRPMEDPETVDARRAEMGLGPAQESLDQMAQAVCQKKLNWPRECIWRVTGQRRL